MSSLRLGWLRRFLVLPADRMVVHQLTAEIAGQGYGRAAHQGQEQAPGQDGGLRLIDAQQPVEGRQRHQHHRQDGMAPGGDQPADAGDDQQIQQADAARQPAADHTDPDQPEAGPGPEVVAGKDPRQIGSYQADQCRHRKVDQHRVQRVAADGHFAGDGFGHVRVAPVGDGRRRRLPVASVAVRTGICLLSLTMTACSGPYSALDPAGPAALDVARLWWGMASFAVVTLLVVVALWLYALKRRPGELDAARARRIQNRWIIGGGLILPISSMALLLVFGIPIGYRMLPCRWPDSRCCRSRSPAISGGGRYVTRRRISSCATSCTFPPASRWTCS